MLNLEAVCEGYMRVIASRLTEKFPKEEVLCTMLAVSLVLIMEEKGMEGFLPYLDREVHRALFKYVETKEKTNG